VVLALAGAACSSGETVVSKSSQPESEPGRVSYQIVVTPGFVQGASKSPTYTRVASADDPWVRHCFDAARVGSGLPFYCDSGRTPLEVWLIALTFPVAFGVTWLVARRAVARLPSPAPAAGEGEGWVLARHARERSAFEAGAGWRRQLRFATERYAIRSGVRGAAYGVALAGLVALVAGRRAATWAFVAAEVHFVAIVLAYAMWAIRGTVDDARHLRGVFVLGAVVGLVLAGVVLMAANGFALPARV
jgi:hypothetical protein